MKLDTKKAEQRMEKIQERPEKKIKVSSKFVTALAIVSILGFIGIISETLFAKPISGYVESLWMFIVGLAFILEARIRRLKTISKGLTPGNFTHFTTAVIGSIAILTGLFSFPLIGFSTPGFDAIKGIISIIAVLVIILQTWFVKS